MKHKHRLDLVHISKPERYIKIFYKTQLPINYKCFIFCKTSA